MKTLQITAMGFLILLLASVRVSAQCGMGGHGSHQGHGQHTSGAAPNVSEARSIASYPLSYCLITGDPLGSHGDPVIRTYNSRQINFCCDKCPAKFEQDQELYLKRLDESIIASQKDDYSLKKCVVSGEKLGGMGEPYDYVYNNELVRFCCAGCVSKFEKDPEKFMNKVHKSSGKMERTKPEEEKMPDGDNQHSTHQH